MTREEAIKVLNGILHLNYRNFWDEECDEAIDIAIEVLSKDKTDRMTREEAIADIKNNIKPVVGGKSLDMAIEALSADVVSREHFDVLKKNYDMQAKLLKEEHAKAVGVERPHGRWIKARMDYGECSECGFFGMTTNYCPNCGAKMKGGNEEC